MLNELLYFYKLQYCKNLSIENILNLRYITTNQEKLTKYGLF